MPEQNVRVGRLFDRISGRSFMVALDRTVSAGPEPYAEDARALIRSVADAGADAMLLSPGLIKQYGSLVAYRGGPALVARIDFPFMPGLGQGDGEEFRLIATVEEAVGLGADAVAMFLTGGYHDRRVFGDNVAAVASVAAACRRLGTPLVVEAVPWGDASPDRQDPKLVADLCRMAAELGADLVKTENVGDEMGRVVRSCPVPVLVLGGPTAPLPDILARTQEALDAGARGVVFGRNSWQRPDAADAMAQLRALVHGRTA